LLPMGDSLAIDRDGLHEPAIRLDPQNVLGHNCTL